MQAFLSQFTIFTTVFLGIFIEAVPFLLLGTVASGLVEMFVSREDLARLVPNNRLGATLVGGLMGFAFPVCECGVVPLTRRLFAKGVPVSAGIAFLLAAPIINPVVLVSTYAAYGWGPILFARFGLGLAVACVVGTVFSFHPAPIQLMLPQALPVFSGGARGAEVIPLHTVEPVRVKLQHAFRIAGDEFFEMGRYLIIGSMLAALMQTLVPQSTLLAIGSGPVRSVLVMQITAFVLSVCSTVDAFLSLAFVRTFTTGSILSFLIFGPMVDIKSTLMFLGVFRRKTVLYLVVLSFLLVLLIGIFVNLNFAW
jgi:uncharacterized protein